MKADLQCNGALKWVLQVTLPQLMIDDLYLHSILILTYNAETIEQSHCHVHLHLHGLGLSNLDGHLDHVVLVHPLAHGRHLLVRQSVTDVLAAQRVAQGVHDEGQFFNGSVEEISYR